MKEKISAEVEERIIISRKPIKGGKHFVRGNVCDVYLGDGCEVLRYGRGILLDHVRTYVHLDDVWVARQMSDGRILPPLLTQDIYATPDELLRARLRETTCKRKLRRKKNDA